MTGNEGGSRAARRRRGLVEFLGVDTYGFQGAATEFAVTYCCPSCHAAGAAAAHHGACTYHAGAAALVSGGLAVQAWRDGDWTLTLTDDGVARFAQIDAARRHGAKRGARLRAPTGTSR